jgi:hypothetical protein
MIRFLQTEGPVKKVVLSGLLLLICGAMAITLIPGIGNNDTLNKAARRLPPKKCGRRRARWRNSKRSSTVRRLR